MLIETRKISSRLGLLTVLLAFALIAFGNKFGGSSVGGGVASQVLHTHAQSLAVQQDEELDDDSGADIKQWLGDVKWILIPGVVLGVAIVLIPYFVIKKRRKAYLVKEFSKNESSKFDFLQNDTKQKSAGPASNPKFDFLKNDTKQKSAGLTSNSKYDFLKTDKKQPPKQKADKGKNKL